jgi:hypothetical protein
MLLHVAKKLKMPRIHKHVRRAFDKISIAVVYAFFVRPAKGMKVIEDTHNEIAPFCLRIANVVSQPKMIFLNGR